MHSRCHPTAYSNALGSKRTCRSCSAGSYNWNNLSLATTTHSKSESAFPQQHHMLSRQDDFNQDQYDRKESSSTYIARQLVKQTRPLLGVRRSPDSDTTGTTSKHQTDKSQNQSSNLKVNHHYMPSITSQQQDTQPKDIQQQQGRFDSSNSHGSPEVTPSQGNTAKDSNTNRNSTPRRTWRISPGRSDSPVPVTKITSIWSQLRAPSPKPTRRSPSPVVVKTPTTTESKVSSNGSSYSNSHNAERIQQGSPDHVKSSPNQQPSLNQPQQNAFLRNTRSLSPGIQRQPQQAVVTPISVSMPIAAPAALPPILTASDRLYLQITEPGNALTSIKELMEFKAVNHSTLIKQLLTLHRDGRLTKEQLGRLYGLSEEAQSTGTGLSWSQVQQAMPQTVRGKQKRCAAAMMFLEALYGPAVTTQEAAHPGLTEMQVAFVEAFTSEEAKADKLRSSSPVSDDAVQNTGVQGADMLKAMSPAAAKKVLAWLEGNTIDQVANPPISKKPIRLLTVQTALVDALKLGVALPEHRLLQDFQLTGDNGQLSFDDVATTIHRLQPHQQDAPALQWYNKVRSEMLAVPQIAAKLTAQEDALGASEGWSFTLQQIRLVAYLIRLHQQQLAARAHGNGRNGVNENDEQEGTVYDMQQQQQQQQAARIVNQKTRATFRPSGLGRA